MKLISVRDVERFKTQRHATLSPVSVNLEFRTLKAAFNTAVKWGVIGKNPFKECAPLRVPFREPTYLSPQEFGALLNVVEDEELRALLQFAVSTMMRRGEISNLEWSDIDFDRRIIHVRNKDNFTVKSRRPRVVPMSSGLSALLRSKSRKGRYVFESAKGQYKPDYLSHVFKKYARKCGLPESIHLHSLRHSGASWLVQNEVPLYHVQKILGHSSISTTQIYSHLSDQNLIQAIDQIDCIPN